MQCKIIQNSLMACYGQISTPKNVVNMNLSAYEWNKYFKMDFIECNKVEEN